MTRRLVLLCVLGVLSGGAFLHAQLRGVKAEVTALLDTDSVHAGDTVRGALTVALPEGFHVQSNKPRDPDLIATELSVDAPAGVTVKEVVFPAAVDLRQAGVDKPLAVFERNFALGVQLTVAPTVAAGAVVVPVQAALSGV